MSKYVVVLSEPNSKLNLSLKDSLSKSLRKNGNDVEVIDFDDETLTNSSNIDTSINQSASLSNSNSCNFVASPKPWNNPKIRTAALVLGCLPNIFLNTPIPLVNLYY